MSYADHRQLEQKTGVKHEYLRGAVFAMAGNGLARLPPEARLFVVLSR